MKNTVIFDLDVLGGIDRTKSIVRQQTDRKPNEAAIMILGLLALNGYYIHIYSGSRPWQEYPVDSDASGVYTITDLQKEWLHKHRVDYYKLIVRSEEDDKASLTAGAIKGRYADRFGVEKILCAYDMSLFADVWKTRGITCFQVAEGNF